MTVEAEFCAAHAIVIQGRREPIHGHNWRVTVGVAGDRLDKDDLLVDFHAMEALVEQVVAPFVNRDFGSVPPFDRLNPTAEAVARHIGDQVAAGLPTLPGGPAARGIRLIFVRVTEAPGCAVVYRP